MIVRMARYRVEDLDRFLTVLKGLPATFRSLR